MKILALETSTELASVSLLWQGQTVLRQLSSPPAHSATLLPAVAALLAEHGCSMSSLDLIACGIGPGAFTGVRLACSVAQGLALGAGLPVAPVCSLLALAESSRADEVYCAMDARMNEAYVAAYRRDAAGWRTLIEPCCAPPDQLPLPPEGDWQGVGTAFAAYPGAQERLIGAVRVADPQARPLADAVARLARLENACDPALLAPLYVRDRVAQTVAERLASGGRA